MKQLFVALTVALAALAIAAPAGAHTGAVEISCEGVTFTYTSFPPGEPASSDETVVVNGGAPIQKTFDFTGPGGTDFIPLNIVGDATVVATFSWHSPSDERNGSGRGQADVSCGGTTTGGTTGGTTTGGTTGGTTTGGTTGGTTTGGTTGTGGVIGSTTGGTPGADTGGELPFTGLPIWIPIALAAVLLLGGGFLLRRRRDEVS